jgi:hypothetical protein
LTTNAQNNLAKNISTNAENEYVTLRVDNDSYIYYHKNMKPSEYNNCLIETNSPIQLFNVYENILRRNFNINTFFYKDIFTDNKQYTETEITKILEEKNIDLFIKIGFNQDVYNKGTSVKGASIGTLVPGVALHGGKSVNTRGKVVNLYVDFYDKQFENIPFIKVVGMKFSKDEYEIGVTRVMFRETTERMKRSKLIYKKPEIEKSKKK